MFRPFDTLRHRVAEARSADSLFLANKRQLNLASFFVVFLALGGCALASALSTLE